MNETTAQRKTRNAKFYTVAVLALTTVFGLAVLTGNRTVEAVGELKIQYRFNDAATDNKIKPELKLVNTTGGAMALSNVKIRYWFTADDASAPTIYCDFATVGCGNLTQTVVSLNPVRTNLIIRFKTA